MDKVLLDYGFGEKGFGLYIRQFDKYQKQRLVAFIPERDTVKEKHIKRKNKTP